MPPAPFDPVMTQSCVCVCVQTLRKQLMAAIHSGAGFNLS